MSDTVSMEQIYDILNGYYEPENTVLCGGVPLEDEFAGDKRCAQLYEQVYQARLRLAEKLGRDEDEDVEAVMNGMNEIARVIGYRMFECGLWKWS